MLNLVCWENTSKSINSDISTFIFSHPSSSYLKIQSQGYSLVHCLYKLPNSSTLLVYNIPNVVERCNPDFQPDCQIKNWTNPWGNRGNPSFFLGIYSFFEYTRYTKPTQGNMGSLLQVQKTHEGLYTNKFRGIHLEDSFQDFRPQVFHTRSVASPFLEYFNISSTLQIYCIFTLLVRPQLFSQKIRCAL